MPVRANVGVWPAQRRLEALLAYAAGRWESGESWIVLLGQRQGNAITAPGDVEADDDGALHVPAVHEGGCAVAFEGALDFGA